MSAQLRCPAVGWRARSCVSKTTVPGRVIVGMARLYQPCRGKCARMARLIAYRLRLRRCKNSEMFEHSLSPPYEEGPRNVYSVRFALSCLSLNQPSTADGVTNKQESGTDDGPDTDPDADTAVSFVCTGSICVWGACGSRWGLRVGGGGRVCVCVCVWILRLLNIFN